MYQDKLLTFGTNQVVESSAASTDVVNAVVAGDAYDQLWFVVQMSEAAAASDSATVSISLETATDEAFSSPVTLFTTPAIAKASLTINSMPVKVRVTKGLLQYVRAYYTVASGPLTKGKFTAFLTPDVMI